MDNNINAEVFESNGNVNISDEVISVISSLAATEVDGVAGMAGGVAGGIAELLGKKNLSKGVKNTRAEDKLTLDLAIVVEYGTNILDVARKVQEKVKNEVESMTGLEVSAINIAVDGVNVPSSEEKATKAQAEEDIIEAE